MSTREKVVAVFFLIGILITIYLLIFGYPNVQSNKFPTMTNAKLSTSLPTKIQATSTTPLAMKWATMFANLECSPETSSNIKGTDITSCKMARAYCEYFPATNGAPTFCNDKPYPNNNFVVVFWGRDESLLDGTCFIVTGVPETYKGKKQIVFQPEDEVDIHPCP